MTGALAFIVAALALGTVSALLFVWRWLIGAELFPLIVATVSLLVIAGALSVFHRLRDRLPPDSPRPWPFAVLLALWLAFYFLVFMPRSVP